MHLIHIYGLHGLEVAEELCEDGYELSAYRLMSTARCWAGKLFVLILRVFPPRYNSFDSLTDFSVTHAAAETKINIRIQSSWDAASSVSPD